MNSNLCYIFTVAGSGDLTVRKILRARLESQSWPLNRETPHQEALSDDDRVLFYGTGTGPDGQRFLASARIAGPAQSISRGTSHSKEWRGKAYSASAQVPIQDPTLFSDPVKIRPLLSDLEFIGNEKYWGVHLMGGVRRIPPGDYKLVVEEAMKSGDG